MGSSGIQLTAEISQHVDHLYTWIRSPTWITAGFAQNHAGPNGANFECKIIYEVVEGLTESSIDTAAQKEIFAQDPISYLHHCKEIESELNQRFKFILNGTLEATQAKEVSLTKSVSKCF